MREAVFSILLLAVAAPVFCTDKDGFNFYKDYLRAKTDEVIPEDPASSERMLYFYRTPVQLYPGLLPALEQEYKKRTNAFKNHMLSKETVPDADHDVPEKRSSKNALAMMLQAKHPHHLEEILENIGASVE